VGRSGELPNEPSRLPVQLWMTIEVIGCRCAGRRRRRRGRPAR
jgi:hypothetical protein